MDVIAILSLIERGITIANALIEAGQSAAPALQAITDLVTGAKKQEVTQEVLDATEAVLDKLIEDFNVELPPVA